MNPPRPITIIGGGLAGLFLGIGLRQRGIPVEIFEAGKYPRHRVCGEFISGRGLQSLQRLGLFDQLISSGARPASTAAFYSGKSSFQGKRLPEPAQCLSRYLLDDLLAQEFVRIGGKLHENTRWSQGFGEGIVRATGRRVRGTVEGWRFFGLKVHARNVDLAADLEMHFVQNGYVGLCQLSDGEVNICGLFRSRTTLADLSSRWRDWLSGPCGSALDSRLRNARFDESSFCSVAGLSLKPQRASDADECSIGDSLTMIPPVTGNGMSMAFESAEQAIGPLGDYCAGVLSWAEARQQIARKCDEAFKSRLAWARRLQAVLFNSVLSRPALMVTSRFPGLWETSFSLTR